MRALARRSFFCQRAFRLRSGVPGQTFRQSLSLSPTEVIVNEVPSPGVELISTRPPSASTLERTTSMPTPRPEMFEIVSAVEKPGAQMS